MSQTCHYDNREKTAHTHTHTHRWPGGFQTLLFRQTYSTAVCLISVFLVSTFFLADSEIVFISYIIIVIKCKTAAALNAITDFCCARSEMNRTLLL